MIYSPFSISSHSYDIILFRQQDQVLIDSRPDIEDKYQDDDSDGEGNILCGNCYNIITKSSNRLSIHGFHRHVFANPYGQVFEIGCFSHVTGCGYTGITTDEFSWFMGYSWKIAVCSNCIAHLGWVFTAVDRERFHGLILNQIVESRSSSSKGLY